MNRNREIITYTGEVFDYLRPRFEDICIEDIAHHLACINRYTGATRVPYSVAEHCVRASNLPVGDPLMNLMHDSAEAYIGDIASPQKQNLGWYDDGFFISYSSAEAEIMRQVGHALDILRMKSWLVTPPDTKQADRIMMATEVRDLMPPENVEYFDPWLDGTAPADFVIEPWGWEKAEREFLQRYEELTNGKS